jgi:hypothetical protein
MAARITFMNNHCAHGHAIPDGSRSWRAPTCIVCHDDFQATKAAERLRERRRLVALYWGHGQTVRYIVNILLSVNRIVASEEEVRMDVRLLQTR